MKILVIEDAHHLRRYITRGLKNAGYAVETAADGEEGLWLAEDMYIDVIVLDLMLPKLDGISLLQRLRDQGNKTHVLILSAKTTVDDRIHGLQEGADDYLTKPFALEELIARVQALIRRKYEVKTNKISIGELSIDMVKRVASLQETVVDLRPREYALLEYMAIRKGHAISRAEIEGHVYDGQKEVFSNVVDSSICILRKKLDSPGQLSYIRTLHRQGYVLNDPSHED